LPSLTVVRGAHLDISFWNPCFSQKRGGRNRDPIHNASVLAFGIRAVRGRREFHGKLAATVGG
jgi:hypothetical protein